VEVVCELMRLEPARIKDYLDLHDHTWPELIQAIRDSGFLEEYIYIHDNLVIVVMKCESFAASVQKLATTPVYQKWTREVRGMLIEDRLIDLHPVWNLASF
jgi:L-rhamnose mutarotase